MITHYHPYPKLKTTYAFKLLTKARDGKLVSYNGNQPGGDPFSLEYRKDMWTTPDLTDSPLYILDGKVDEIVRSFGLNCNFSTELWIVEAVGVKRFDSEIDLPKVGKWLEKHDLPLSYRFYLRDFERLDLTKTCKAVRLHVKIGSPA